eukprot:2537488-Prymnesium_polylepis.1
MVSSLLPAEASAERVLRLAESAALRLATGRQLAVLAGSHRHRRQRVSLWLTPLSSTAGARLK